MNAMLLMDVINSYLLKKPESENEVNGRHKISCVEELVSKTLCNNFTRDCVDRKCSECGVEVLLTEIRVEVGERLNEMREWKRWEKTDTSPKDLVHKNSLVTDLIHYLKEDLIDLAKHVKTAQWQRRQYQSLRENLPPGHAILTADYLVD